MAAAGTKFRILFMISLLSDELWADHAAISVRGPFLAVAFKVAENLLLGRSLAPASGFCP
jgi:hypothetical protein